MIVSLTKAQEASLHATLEKWLAIGRSVKPINRKAVTGVIREMYSRLGRPEPTVLFLSSPLMCCLAHAVLSNISRQLESQLGSQLGSQLRIQLESRLRSQLGIQLESRLGSQLRNQLGIQLESQLRSQLGSQLRIQLESRLRSQLGIQLGSQLGSYFAGSHWCAWEVFYMFCREIGVNYSNDESHLLDIWLTQSAECSWWWPYDGIVLASDRPRVLRVDQQGRLHNETGPAIQYSDGWGIWAWHGVRVDQDIIERPETITSESIVSERNAEIRRVKLAKFGEGKFISESGAEAIHADQFGQLFTVPVDGDEPLTMVKVLNSTPEPSGHPRDTLLREFHPLTLVQHDGAMMPLCQVPACLSFKTYFIRVPPAMKRAREAVAWTFEKKEMEYDPYFET